MHVLELYKHTHTGAYASNCNQFGQCWCEGGCHFFHCSGGEPLPSHYCFPILSLALTLAPRPSAPKWKFMVSVECILHPCTSLSPWQLSTYEVQYRGVDSPNDVIDMFYEAVTVSAGTELSYIISGLMAYFSYKCNVSVRATNQYGVGDFSEEVTVRTEEGGECTLKCVVREYWLVPLTCWCIACYYCTPTLLVNSSLCI